ncbi:MAG TPA: S8 family peptidase [Acidimicrobiia bacterium]
MRLVMAALLALVALPSPPLPAAESGTVRLLVPADSSLGLATADENASQTGWVRVEVPLSKDGVAETAGLLEDQIGQEVIVEQRYELFGPEQDPGFPEQWYLENTGQAGGRADADIDALTAWGLALGDGVVVAVIDSGVNMSHSDLDGQTWANPGDPVGGGDNDGNGHTDDFRGWDFVSNDNDPSPGGTNDNEGHGTAVAGIIAAEANGSGTVGVAPQAQLMVIRACSLGGCWSLDISEAVHYAVDEGADIINLSLGSITSEDSVLEGAIEYARARDVLVVAAAGNEGRNLDDLPIGQQLIPGGLPHSNILTVTASDRRDDLAGFSNYGPEVVDVVAPGAEILTTGVTGNYVTAHGTSFASPLVAGVAALLLSAEPGTGHQEIVARIMAFVDRPNGVAGASGSGRVNSGRALTNHFIDTTGSVFVNAIEWLADMGITTGCNPPQNHRFCPGSSVTRGEMAVFLTRAFHLPETGTDYFDDDDGQFYEGSANRLRAAGLTVGCGERRYCGGERMGRDEMAAMLSRALSLPVSGSDFFTDDETSVFEGAINRIAQAGITVGCNPPSNTRYCPNGSVSRGEMAAFIKRSVELPG